MGRTARRAAWTCGALAALAWSGVASAQSVCLGYGDVGTWYESAECQATVCSDGTQTGVLEFKDADGQVLQSVTMQAAGCVSVPVPHGTANYDWKLKTPDPVPEAWAASGPGSPPAIGGGVSLGHTLLGAGEVVLGCVSTEVVRHEPAVALAFRVATGDLAEADALVAPVVVGGPGTPVASAVTVGAYVVLVHDGVTATISSSLPGRFERFVLDVDGRVLADLQTDQGVEVLVEPNGWRTLRADVPVGAALPGQTVTLRQKGRHDDREVVLVLEV